MTETEIQSIYVQMLKFDEHTTSLFKHMEKVECENNQSKCMHKMLSAQTKNIEYLANLATKMEGIMKILTNCTLDESLVSATAISDVQRVLEFCHSAVCSSTRYMREVTSTVYDKFPEFDYKVESAIKRISSDKKLVKLMNKK